MPQPSKMSKTPPPKAPTCAYVADEDGGPLPHDSAAPQVTAQFFYVSDLPIDDPLSPVPPMRTKNSAPGATQPFSVRDNAALEEAWRELMQREERERPQSRETSDNGMVSFPMFKGNRGETGLHSTEDTAETNIQSVGTDFDLTESRSRRRQASTNTSNGEIVVPGVGDQRKLAGTDLSNLPQRRKDVDAPFRHVKERVSTNGSNSPMLGSSVESHLQEGHLSNDISGRPFARAPSGRNISKMVDDLDQDQNVGPVSRSASRESRGKGPQMPQERLGEYARIPVGVSRLHLVELPDLQMQPIYWSPINDTSTVIRATWFFKDNMLPLPAEVSNRLEIGYEYIKPYVESYQDELQACIENGPAAEMKIVHKIWKENRSSSRPTSAANVLETDAITELPVLPKDKMNTAFDPRNEEKRMFETHSVIYIDRRNAQILRPSSLPSSSQKRAPLNSIKKGRQIGVAVVRGFDRKLWTKLHPDPKMTELHATAKLGASMSRSGTTSLQTSPAAACESCEKRYQTSKVTDLVLVIHGIGQKLSERVDSYHFTHAINALRREFNVELANGAINRNVEPSKGMMVLPINWRLTMSFDDEVTGQRQFGLKDITPDTLPAVRSIISDVMLDIPYYMSHHKDKMTSAVIREANRVYRLWCRNNPLFSEYGRVHIVAHSLGSVMCLDILSNQPLGVPQEVDMEVDRPSAKIFEFNTTNLFCCGSPSGFFLLLNNARLIPRAGVEKRGMTSESHNPDITAESQYGSLAVQNVYNLCHRNDPIAYLLNASVDADYAASLKQANVPSSSQGLFTRMATSLRLQSEVISDPYHSQKAPERPQMTQMPSTVELETHDFTREEIAEKRMYLLNDNGQIDFHLASSGGPLEFQYLSMLSAHSSYWISKEFVRFLVVEIGRKEGRENTLPVLRAVKKREWKRGALP